MQRFFSLSFLLPSLDKVSCLTKTSQTSRSFYTAAQTKAQFYTRFSSSLTILNPRFGGSLGNPPVFNGASR